MSAPATGTGAGASKNLLHVHEHTCTCFFLHMQVPFKLPLQLSWRCGPDMPFGMSNYVQSVVVKRTVYFGGGHAGIGSDNNHIVMTYDISTCKWARLPTYKASYFAMTTINYQLVLVGGDDHGDRTKLLGVWDADNKQWTHPYPEMHIARSHCSAVVYKEWLVVTGGVSTSGAVLSSVEVMKTNSKLWFSGPPTPIQWSYMKTAVVGDTCYFMGGAIGGISTDKVYTLSLSALTVQLTSREKEKNKSPWKEISGIQLMNSTPLTISGSLLAVGGEDVGFKSTTAIRLYQPDTGEWVKVGNLPTPRRDCICAMIADKEMLVAGGHDRKSILKSTDIALLKY